MIGKARAWLFPSSFSVCSGPPVLSSRDQRPQTWARTARLKPQPWVA